MQVHGWKIQKQSKPVISQYRKILSRAYFPIEKKNYLRNKIRGKCLSINADIFLKCWSVNNTNKGEESVIGTGYSVQFI